MEANDMSAGTAARVTVATAAARLVDLLPDRLEPEVSGKGGPRTTEPGYRSSFVRFGGSGRPR